MHTHDNLYNLNYLEQHFLTTIQIVTQQLKYCNQNVIDLVKSSTIKNLSAINSRSRNDLKWYKPIIMYIKTLTSIWFPHSYLGHLQPTKTDHDEVNVNVACIHTYQS